MSHILVIEDEIKIQEILTEFLQENGHTVDCAGDGLVGVAMFQKGSYDLILMDVMMPKIDGFAVLELIRQESNIPIIMITAMEGEEYQAKGFDLQADDYITKPFSMNLVIRRIEAVLRRVQIESTPTDKLRHKHIMLDKEACEVQIAGNAVPFTYKEYEILKLLLEHKNKVFTRDELLRQIWGYDFIGDDKTVNNHIMRIRKKLGEDMIVTVRGMGYKLGE